MDPHASGSNDSDHDYEHLDHPDPHEYEQYKTSIQMNKMTDQQESQQHETLSKESGLDDYLHNIKEKGQELYGNIQNKGENLIENIKDTTNDYLEQTSDKLNEAKDKSDDLFGQSSEKHSEYLYETKNEPHELKEHVDEAGMQYQNYLQEAENKGNEYMEEAKNLGHDILDLAQDREEELIKNAPEKIEELVDINPTDDTGLPEDIKDDHHYVENLQSKQIIDELFNEPQVKEEPREPTPPKDIPEPIHDDIQDNVKEEIPAPIRHSPLTDDRSHIEAGIESAVNDTHDEVEEILNRLHTTPPPQDEQQSEIVEEQTTPSDENDTVGKLIGEQIHEQQSQIPISDSLSSDMREISPDEQTFDRQGPLTIPTSTTQKQDEPSEDDFEQISPHSHFDDLPARPPTPPKDLSDEPIQPPSIDLGPPSHPHVHERSSLEHGLKPILRHSGQPWIDFKTVDPKVLDIIYWRDPKKSGIALGVILIALFLVSRFSLISLLAYGSLAVLIGTLGFRIFKIVEAKIQKTEAAHPFKEYLEKDLDVPQDRVHAQVDVLVENGRNVINHLRRLFFVENLCDSVKFGLLLWTLTYIGAWFSGFALIILFVIGVFSVPKVYEIYKEPIDANLALVKEHVEKVHNTLTENLPFLNKICPTQQAQKKEE